MRQYDIGDVIMREAYKAWLAAGSPKRAFLKFLWKAEKRIETAMAVAPPTTAAA